MDERRVTPAMADLLEMAVLSVQIVHGASLLAMVLVDEKGVYLHYRPGQERDVARYLASVDWATASRVVGEHTP